MNNQIENKAVKGDASERPLVTFALFAYNQEKYIREAVVSALAQTYQPLEIILSDDSSRDSTFEIMQEITNGYTGPHQIVLNKNENNLGIGDHINKVMSIAQGELIVVAAGDDVSLPHRVERVVSCWLASDKQSHSIYSSVINIDKDGRELGRHTLTNRFNNKSALEIAAGNPWVLGASHAWSQRVFSEFGTLMPSVVHEDRVIPFRSILLGKVSLIEEPLVKYRVDVGISSGYSTVKSVDDELRIIERYIQDFRQKIQDSISLGRDDLVPTLNARLRRLEIAALIGKRETNAFDLITYSIKNKVSFFYTIKQLLKYRVPGIYWYLSNYRWPRRKNRSI